MMAAKHLGIAADTSLSTPNLQFITCNVVSRSGHCQVEMQMNPVRDTMFIAWNQKQKSESHSDGMEIRLKSGFGEVVSRALKSLLQNSPH